MSTISISFCCNIFSKNMLVRYRGINNNTCVLERPWTKWKVLRAISSTLKFQFTVKCWKVDFLMPCKNKSCQTSREKLCMVRVLLPDTPRPPQFQPELPFFYFLQYFQFFWGKIVFLVIQVEIGEVWGCPGGARWPYPTFLSNFGRI